MRPTLKAGPPNSVRVALLIGTGWSACGPTSDDASDSLRWSAGVAAYSTPLTVPLGNRREKHCQATILGRSWAMTAAHCLTDAPVDGRARLEGPELGFSIAEVEVHPLAHESGATRIESTWTNSEIRAAHDLALIPLGNAFGETSEDGPTHDWNVQCAAQVGTGVGVQFAAGDAEIPLTGHGQTLGHTAASALLGESQEGAMIAVYGSRPTRGDSGSGLVAPRAHLPEPLADCLPPALSLDTHVLLGVVQNAPDSSDALPFGVVPLYTSEHASWLRRIIGAPSQTSP